MKSYTTAAILAGGTGTRLRSVVSDRQKVLAEVGGRPFLTYLLDPLVDAGISRIVLSTGYRADQVREFLGTSYRNAELIYSPEDAPLGTAGALRLAASRAQADSLLAMNGDSYLGLDLRAFVEWHSEKSAPATMAITRVDHRDRFGSVEVDSLGRVTRFLEKSAHKGTGWINGGVYLLERNFLESIPPGRAVSIEKEVFPAWVGRGLSAYRCQGMFLDIGTPETYAQAATFLERAPAVVLDRDGTLIVERDHLTDPDQVELLPGVASGLRRLREKGFRLVVVTNQSVIARSLLSEEGLERVHERMREHLAREGASVDAIYHCPHRMEDGCSCRKPKPTLLERAAREWRFDPTQCFVVGDKVCDIDLGRAAGARTILVRTGYGRELEGTSAMKPRWVVDNLEQAADRIISAQEAHHADQT